jgi:hypothetical protein
MSERIEDRRQTTRKRTLKGARIIFNHRRSVINCVVHNLTAHGALLRVPNIFGIPSDFDIQLDGEAEHHSAHVVWRNKDKLGVRWD